MILSDSFYMDIQSIVLAHEFVLNKNNRCDYPDGRRIYGLVYCIEGEAEYRFYSGEHCTVHAGDLIFLSPSAAYRIVTKKEFKHYTVNFEIHAASSSLSFLDGEYYRLCTDNAELFRHNFKNLIQHWSLKKTCFEMQATAALYELMAQFAAEVGEEKYSANAHRRLQPAKEYIEKHVDAPVNLNTLANLSNMSVTNFRREWAKLYGISPLQYRDTLRLCHAKDYLLIGYYTVSEVAEKCGFSDVNYFIRFFKKHTGLSPGKFLKNVQ